MLPPLLPAQPARAAHQRRQEALGSLGSPQGIFLPYSGKIEEAGGIRPWKHSRDVWRGGRQIWRETSSAYLGFIMCTGLCDLNYCFFRCLIWEHIWVDLNIKEIQKGSGARSRAETDRKIRNQGGDTEMVLQIEQIKRWKKEVTCLASRQNCSI